MSVSILFSLGLFPEDGRYLESPPFLSKSLQVGSLFQKDLNLNNHPYFRCLPVFTWM